MNYLLLSFCGTISLKWEGSYNPKQKVLERFVYFAKSPPQSRPPTHAIAC